MVVEVQSYSLHISYISYNLLLIEGETQFYFHCGTYMNNGISKTTIIDDIHAYPYIHRTEYFLLILFIFACMIEKDTM